MLYEVITDLTPEEWQAFYLQALAVKNQTRDLKISFDDPVIASLPEYQEKTMVKGSSCGKLSLHLHVITSYSIHYTKLYDYNNKVKVWQMKKNISLLLCILFFSFLSCSGSVESAGSAWKSPAAQW